MMRVIALLLIAVLCGCHAPQRAEAPVGPHFRVLTYNVNWAVPRPDLAASIIRQSRADIVCLQETTPDWERFLRQTLGSEYPFMEFRESEGRMGGGLAFLSRVPASEVAYLPSETGWFDGWIMSFQTMLGPVQVLNVHLRPPVSDTGSWASGYFSTGDDRLREMERFYDHRRADMPILIAGDYNDGENSPVLRWLEEQGLVNALPQFDYGTPTWEWRTSVGTLQRRMDHIVY